MQSCPQVAAHAPQGRSRISAVRRSAVLRVLQRDVCLEESLTDLGVGVVHSAQDALNSGLQTSVVELLALVLRELLEQPSPEALIVVVHDTKIKPRSRQGDLSRGSCAPGTHGSEGMWPCLRVERG